MAAPLGISSDSRIVDPGDVGAARMPKTLCRKEPEMRCCTTDDGREVDTCFIDDG